MEGVLTAALRLGACLSLSGRHSYFGRQAAVGLEAWQRLTPNVELRVEDDQSDTERLRSLLPRLAARCDLLLGPYSTGLARAAAAVAPLTGRLLWNHGGAGDDVQALSPGHVVSVLTPASRYAAPFLHWLASRSDSPAPLRIVHGAGRFGVQVAAGAQAAAASLGIEAFRTGTGNIGQTWDLFCAGSFEEDVETVRGAARLTPPPRSVCAVAAGVQRFGTALADVKGVFGVAQWFPGRQGTVDCGPPEAHFLDAYSRLAGDAPDYPAVQAAAAAALAVHCADLAASVEPAALMSTAAALEAVTLFGRFKIDTATGAQTGHETVLVRWGPKGQLLPSPLRGG